MLRLFLRAHSTAFPGLPGLSRRMATHSGSGALNEYDYVYLPPGCSLKEPSYHSARDPVFYTDPTPADKEAFASVAPQSEVLSKVPAPQSEVLAETSLPAQQAAAAAAKQHAMKMVEEYSQQTYVYPASGLSMKSTRAAPTSDPKPTPASDKRK